LPTSRFPVQEIFRRSKELPLDMARLSGSRLLLDKVDRTGLTSTTRRESAGMQTSKDDVSIYTHTRLYLRGHVTAKGNARLWLWTRLWAPLRGLLPWLHVPPLTVATPSLQSQLYVGRKDIYKAPMPYPHLDPYTSGGMSMTIAPPGGPTRKHCLGPQVSLWDLYLSLGVASSKPQVCGRWKVNIGLYWRRKLLLNKFRIDEAWELALFDVTGLSRLPCNEGKGTQSR
jgi:hypothetical protein